MEALRKGIIAFWGLVLAAIAALIAVALVNHQFAYDAVDCLDRCFVYNLRLCFVEGQNLWLAIGAGVLFAALAVGSFIVAFHRPRLPRSVQVSALDGSMVDVSLSAVDNVVQRAAMQVTEARNIYSKLRMHKDGLEVRLQITVPQGMVIPEVGAQVRRQVAEQLEAMVGIVPQQISVEIAQVLVKPEEGK